MSEEEQRKLAEGLHDLFCTADHEEKPECEWFHEEWDGSSRRKFLKMAKELVKITGSSKKAMKVVSFLKAVKV